MQNLIDAFKLNGFHIPVSQIPDHRQAGNHTQSGRRDDTGGRDFAKQIGEHASARIGTHSI